MSRFTMKLSGSMAAAAAAGLVLLAAGSAKASPLLNLTVEASTTGVAGTYVSILPVAPTTGSTLYFEIFAMSALPATTNSNTAKTPNGTTDSLIALPNFTVSSPTSEFTASTLLSNFGTGSGASAGTITGFSSSIDVRAIELGFTENDDTLLPIDSGTLIVGSGFTGITASTDLPVVNSGSLRVAGSPVAVTETTATSADPLLGYTPVIVGVPEPTTIGLGLVVGSGLLARRRRQA